MYVFISNIWNVFLWVTRFRRLFPSTSLPIENLLSFQLTLVMLVVHTGDASWVFFSCLPVIFLVLFYLLPTQISRLLVLGVCEVATVLRAVQALHMFFNFLLDVFARLFCAALMACVGVLLFWGQSCTPRSFTSPWDSLVPSVTAHLFPGQLVSSAWFKWSS